MNLKTNLKHLVAAVALSVATVPAFAIVTYDPTNWVQNFASAKAAIRQEVTMAKTLIQETQAAINMAKSVKAMANMDTLTQVKTALKLYKELKNVDVRLEKDFEMASELTERIKARVGASPMSWEEYIKSKNKIDKQQRETATQRYRAINDSIEQTSRQREAIVAKLATVQGQTEAMQTVGASIDVMIGQNQQIITLLAANQKIADTNETLKKVDVKKGEDEAVMTINAYQKRLREAASKY